MSYLTYYSDVQSTLRTTRPLFSSYLRIRTLATSATSVELQQSRSELLSTLKTLSTDLADLVDSVRAVEHDPYRYGLDVEEVSRRRLFVQDVGGEVESMRRELEETVEKAGSGGAGGSLLDPAEFGSGEREEDPYGEFEAQQQTEMMHEQDEQLDGVFRTVGVLRGQAEDMGRELEDQGHMLDEVDTLADRVGGKLQNGVKKVGYIIKKNEGESSSVTERWYPRLVDADRIITDTVSSCCIAILIFALILLLILVIIL